jgi:hypothetical protein
VAALASSAWTSSVNDPVLPVHYSVNTNAAVLGVTYFSDVLTTLTAEAGWASTGATPTPTSPGAVASADDLAKAAAVDATSWATDLAVAEGAYNYQLMRFSLPSSPTTSAVKSFSVAWTGHGEPSAGHPTSVYLWNNATSRWDQVSTGIFGTDTAVKNVADTTQSRFCLRCHTSSPPAGIKMPASLPNLGTAWMATTTAGDMHGDRAGVGYGGTILPGNSRGSKGIPCMTCHDPHGNANLYHLSRTINDKSSIVVTTSAQAENVCSACHAGNPDVWHANCNNCHFDPDAHETRFWVGSGTDCLSCHKHNTVWRHPPACHCAPYPDTFRTF